jgi:hypothetical protein
VVRFSGVSQRSSLLPESNCAHTEYMVTRKVALAMMGRYHNFQLRYDQSIELLPSANWLWAGAINMANELSELLSPEECESSAGGTVSGEMSPEK